MCTSRTRGPTPCPFPCGLSHCALVTTTAFSNTVCPPVHTLVIPVLPDVATPLPSVPLDDATRVLCDATVGTWLKLDTASETAVVAVTGRRAMISLTRCIALVFSTTDAVGTSSHTGLAATAAPCRMSFVALPIHSICSCSRRYRSPLKLFCTISLPRIPSRRRAAVCVYMRRVMASTSSFVGFSGRASKVGPTSALVEDPSVLEEASSVREVGVPEPELVAEAEEEEPVCGYCAPAGGSAKEYHSPSMARMWICAFARARASFGATMAL